MNTLRNHHRHALLASDQKHSNIHKTRVLTYVNQVLITIIIQLTISIIFFSTSFNISIMKRILYMESGREYQLIKTH